MAETNWLQLIVAILGGGAIGAIITAFVTSYRLRIQPVGKRFAVMPVFRKSDDTIGLDARVTCGNGTTFDNLFLVNVTVVNRGNKDFECFDFGVTLSNGDRCIHVDRWTSDRHHDAIIKTDLSPNEPKEVIDFQLRPFNRRERYDVTLYLVIHAGSKAPTEVQLSSPLPIRFVDNPTFAEIFLHMLEKANFVQLNEEEKYNWLTWR